MDPVWVATAISVFTLVLSVSISLVSAGIKLGQIEQKLTHMATREEVASIKESLAKIEGMFTLKLKDLNATN